VCTFDYNLKGNSYKLGKKYTVIKGVKLESSGAIDIPGSQELDARSSSWLLLPIGGKWLHTISGTRSPPSPHHSKQTQSKVSNPKVNFHCLLQIFIVCCSMRGDRCGQSCTIRTTALKSFEKASSFEIGAKFRDPNSKIRSF